MKVIHVVTFVSKDGAFGGPLAVAISQLEDLDRIGISTQLVAGWDGVAEIGPKIRKRLFRAWKIGPGFVGIISPGLYKYVATQISEDEVLHIHLGRDLTTMIVATIARLTKRRYLVQTHGMISDRSGISYKLFDSIFTRPVLRSAEKVFVLTEFEKRQILTIDPKNICVSMLPNGIKDSYVESSQLRNESQLVFIARLHPRKRVVAFVEMCGILRDRGLDFTAKIYGPDEGDLSNALSAIEQHNLNDLVQYCGPIQQGAAIRRLSEAGVFVLPSFGEVFPMTILESLVARTPVVTTTQSGMAAMLEEMDAAEVTSGSPIDLANAVQGILDSGMRRDELINNGIASLNSRFRIDKISEELALSYRGKNLIENT